MHLNPILCLHFSFLEMGTQMFICNKLSIFIITRSYRSSKCNNNVIIHNGEGSHLQNWRAPHEPFPTKSVPHQILAGLEILRKYCLAGRCEQIEEHVFWFYIYFRDRYYSILIKLAYNCLISCYLQYSIWNTVIINFPFLFQAG